MFPFKESKLGRSLYWLVFPGISTYLGSGDSAAAPCIGDKVIKQSETRGDRDEKLHKNKNKKEEGEKKETSQG